MCIYIYTYISWFIDWRHKQYFNICNKRIKISWTYLGVLRWS